MKRSKKMGEVAKITDGVAICLSDRVLRDMGPDAARRLERDIKKTIKDAGMVWVLQRDEMRRELCIIPMAHSTERD